MGWCRMPSDRVARTMISQPTEDPTAAWPSPRSIICATSAWSPAVSDANPLPSMDPVGFQSGECHGDNQFARNLPIITNGHAIILIG